MSQRLSAFVLASLLSSALWAESFVVGNIHYDVIPEAPTTVEVVDLEPFSESAIVPAKVSYSGKSYDVVRLADDAFRWSTALKNVSLPNSVTEIGSSAFGECEQLTTVDLPNSVKTIGIATFWGCINLKTISLPNSLTEIPSQMFAECTALSSITIPSTVSVIGSSAFYDCTNLKSVVLPLGLTTIEKWAFNNCSSISSIEISNTVTHIGQWAFLDCTNLKSITNYATTPQTIDDETFGGISSSATVHVTVGYKSVYQAAPYWSNMKIVDDIYVPHTLEVGNTGYATLYLNYDVTIPSGVQVYVGSSVSNGYLTLKEISGAIPANTGVIIKANQGKYTFAVATAATAATSVLKGTITDTSVEPNTVLTLAEHDGEVGFYSYSGTTLHANRAYLPGTYAAAKLRIDEDVTGILSVEEESISASMYDINGRRQQHLGTGLNIVNGKVVYIK